MVNGFKQNENLFKTNQKYKQGCHVLKREKPFEMAAVLKSPMHHFVYKQSFFKEKLNK